MFNKAAEKTASSILLIGTPFTCLFLVLRSVTDPVNATKLAAAGGLGFSLFFLFIFFAGRKGFAQYKSFLIASLAFLLASINAAINSESPLAQNIYGAYGRNTGLIAYLVLSMVAIGALLLRTPQNFTKIIWGLQFAGIVNVLYCGWVIAFGDFLSWSNPYGNILGLFGNPNFISAFLGMFITTLMAFAATKSASWKYRVVAILVGLIAFYVLVHCCRLCRGNHRNLWNLAKRSSFFCLQDLSISSWRVLASWLKNGNGSPIYRRWHGCLRQLVQKSEIRKRCDSSTRTRNCH